MTRSTNVTRLKRTALAIVLTSVIGAAAAQSTTSNAPAQMEAFLKGFSIEVMPRTAEKVESFRAILPAGTRVYIAHIDGTPIEDMVATAKRIQHSLAAAYLPTFLEELRALLPEQRFRIRKHDVIACPTGDATVAHQIINTGSTDLRYLAISNLVEVETCEYPDSGKFMAEAGLTYWFNRG